MTLTAPVKNLVHDPRRYAEHARSVAQAFGITLTELEILPREVAGAVMELREVICTPIMDETSYAVAMHELGHFLAPSGSIRTARDWDNWKLKLTEEHAAWEWAEHHALDWTPGMQHVKQLALASYEENYIRHQIEQARKARLVITTADARTFAKNIRWHE